MRKLLPSRSKRSSCTNPFPKDLLPTIIARSLSCKAPANISLAEAEYALISTTVFVFSNKPPEFDLYICSPLFLPFVFSIISPPFKNSSAMSVAAVKTPPPLFLKSSTNFVIPISFNREAALLKSRAVGTEN